MKARVIAFYLPQFHPTPENDEWWGKGFTEWTCISKAKPLFKGHYQPRVPADLGYYDLRVPESREMQAEYAKKAGIEGFCYWHYWFGTEGSKKRLLERPFNEVLESGKPDFPFMLGWANHSWYAKLWDKDTSKDKLLIEQKYCGKEDYLQHFQFALKAFQDHRYIKDGDKPLFFIFRPLDIPEDFIPYWQNLAKQAGFENGISFVGQCRYNDNPAEILAKGFSYVYMDRTGLYYSKYSLIKKIKQHIKAIFKIKPLLAFDYADYVKSLEKSDIDSIETNIPTIMPNWDHSPRSGDKGLILTGSTPRTFSQHAKRVIETVMSKPKGKRFIFLKSWNEWGEGNYMEPDQKFGNAYIQALADVLND